MNELEKLDTVPKYALSQLVIMLAPFAPHLAEYLWEKLDGEVSLKTSVHQQPWPIVTPVVATESEVVVQVSGRRRGSIRISQSAEEAEVLAEALKISSVTTALAGKEYRRVVYVPNKIINIII